MIKEKDYLSTIADQCLSKAKKLGSTEASVLVINSVSENVNIRNRKLDGSTRSENLGIALTTYIGKKKSSIFSSDLNEKNLDNLIDRCVESTKITPEDELNSLADKELYFKGDKNLDLYDETVLENQQKIDYINEAETEASLKISRLRVLNAYREAFFILRDIKEDHPKYEPVIIKGLIKKVERRISIWQVPGVFSFE